MLYKLINIQYASNMHANKQLVNSENWSLNKVLPLIFVNWLTMCDAIKQQA